MDYFFSIVPVSCTKSNQMLCNDYFPCELKFDFVIRIFHILGNLLSKIYHILLWLMKMNHLPSKNQNFKFLPNFEFFTVLPPLVKFELKIQLSPICLINGSFESPLNADVNTTKHSLINQILRVKTDFIWFLYTKSWIYNNMWRFSLVLSSFIAH